MLKQSCSQFNTLAARRGLACALLLLSLTSTACASPAGAGGGPTGPSSVREAFPPPRGAERVACDAFGEWLGSLRVLDASEPVRTYRGDVVPHRARVVDLPLVSGDLQQCADSLIRLRAEWLRVTGGEIMFHATSGDPIPWTRWHRGERPFERGGRLHWRGGGRGDWEGYLSAVFTWAGTRSLGRDTVAVSEPRPGDMLLVPGSPGHVVLLLDVARREDEIYVLIGEGYMPAQSFHVELGPEQGWWRFQPVIDLGHVQMPAEGLRRWAR